MRVLLVEDNEFNRTLLRDILALLEVEILEAVSGVQAIELARASRADLILMDLRLPGLDGFEATRLLKSDPATGHIPVVAVTSYAFEGERRRFLSAGGDGYIAKPLDVDQVLEVVRGYMEGREGRGLDPGR